jgi:hypothetical protein
MHIDKPCLSLSSLLDLSVGITIFYVAKTVCLDFFFCENGNSINQAAILQSFWQSAIT